jgi:hypothetical protein
VRKLGLTLLLLLFALPLAAQINDTYVIPVVANVPGNFGTRWMSQISIFNPQLDVSLKVSVVYLPTGGGKGAEVLITVPSNSVALADNILQEWFHISNGSGALVVATFPEDGNPSDLISRSFLVTTNTFNNSSSGTFGQTIAGIWTGLQDYSGEGVSAISHGIRNISRFGWRTNFGALNIGDTPATLRINVYDNDGKTLIKNATYTVPAQGHNQWALPVELDRGAIEFFVDDSTKNAVVFPYTSTIDQYSGDPTYQSPALLASASYLYGKGKPMPTTIGRKITIDDARAIRLKTTMLGEVKASVRAGR